MASPAPRLSVVLPVFNEAENLGEMLDRIGASVRPLGTFEIVVVDDGSNDKSVDVALERKAHGVPVRVLQLSRNFGHQSALLAGLHSARGDAVVLMDSDGQDPPELLPELVRAWQDDGYEVVYGIRRRRQEAAWKRISYSVFYRVLYRLAELRIPPDAGDFCLMDRVVVDALKALPESSRFLRGLRSWVGFRQVGIPYDRPARLAGEPKYKLRNLVRLAVDGMLAFSTLPLRLASILGFVVSFLGVCYLGFAVVGKVFGSGVPEGWTSLIALMLLLGGGQLVVVGVLGEYIARIYTETKRRPLYLIAREFD